MVLNGDLTIASDLDIYERVGRGIAHDEYIEFEVKGGKILYQGDESELTKGKMRIEFIKVGSICFDVGAKNILLFFQSYRDNPKVNAIVLTKGRLSGWFRSCA